MEKELSRHLTKNIYEYIRSNDIKGLRKLVSENNSVDVADALMKLERIYAVKVIRVLESDIAADVFTYLNNDYKEYIVKTFSSIEILDILKELFSDDIVSLLDEMPANITTKILRATNKEIRTDINKILKYNEDTAGSIMSVDFIELKKDYTLKEALEYIKKIFKEFENTNSYYVVSTTKKLLGEVSIQDLVFNDQNMKLTDIMTKKINSVFTDSDQEEVANIFKKYDLTEAPVVNKQFKLVGIITIDDIVDIIEEENTEDIEKLAGILPSERSYFELSIRKMVKLRVFWLLFLMVSATLSQAVINVFMKIYNVNDDVKTVTDEITLVVTTMIVPVIPLISGTSGNAGSQSSIMVVRGLSLGTVKTSDWLRIIYKELRVGILVGSILLPVNFIRMYVIDVFENKWNWKLDQNHWDIIVSLSLSLLITIIISKIIGGILPVIAKIIKIDPAVIAAPLLTTLVDALSTAIFFSINLAFFFRLIS